MNPTAGYYIAGPAPPEVQVTRSGVPLLLPKVDPSLIREVSRALRSRHEELSQRPLESIVDSVDRASRVWMDPKSPYRRLAEAALPSICGFSPETVRWGLDRLFGSIRRPELRALLSEEFASPSALDGFVRKDSRSLTRALGPPLTLQILSGNVLGPAVEALVFSLLVKSPTLLKPAVDEPILAALFASSLAEIDPKLSACLAVVPWTGGDAPLEAAAFEASESVVAYGGGEALRDLTTRLPPHLSLISFGPRLSIGLVARDRISAETAASAALDVARFDMRGCLSPQLIYVEEKGSASAERFCSLLSDELQRLEDLLPTGTLSQEEMARSEQLRSTYAMRGATLFRGPGFTVVFDPSDEPLCGSGPGRWVLIRPWEDLLSLPERLRPLRGSLQAVGLAVGADRRGPLVERLTRLGIPRICPIGTLQEPPFSWHQEGRLRLANRVRWTDLEE